MIYLDHNATTPPPPEVVDVIARHLAESYANPGSRHQPGRQARRVLETARESMAEILGADPRELVFTSGGTEANNMAVLGFTAGPPGVIALTAGEHPAVMEAARFRMQSGWRLQTLPVDGNGLLKTGAPLETDVRLACVILAHNETGVLQDVTDLSERCATAQVPLHLDAVQAVGKVPVNFHATGAASLALGAHKFGGPRGVGALLLREGWRLTPVSFGGHQEAERRPGTECVALIAGMVKALEIVHRDQARRHERLQRLRDRLQAGLSEQCAPARINGSRTHRLPNTLNIAFPGVDGEALLVALDLEGVACSLGSTCASGSAEPAPVLAAMGVPLEAAKSSVRFSLGVTTTDDEITTAIEIVGRVVQRLRSEI